MILSDLQVLTLVKARPGMNLYEIKKAAAESMQKWKWSIGKIQKSVQRLEESGKVETERVISGGRACILVRPK
jgi:DNA-binding PadR family transcriptional regulator